ncbi:hypothetical protein [Fibrella aquatilis]|uniref:Uncharacterized protein n=1 Tax=Fibrella aquatilis TaxID=2817059 RepID=A0A939G185_9BACT|nr:hypothetical protein [Fibrella aquatilis]MBO0930001.1 hypothetical protein [Fibrella aquatilis]
MDSIVDYIDEEKDVLYVREQRKAKEQAQHLFVERSLLRGKATVEEIAEDCGVSVDYVPEIQRQLT